MTAGPITRSKARLLALVALAIGASALAACGGGDEPAPGTAKSPLVADTSQAPAGRSNESQPVSPGTESVTDPNYERLVAAQTSKPRERFTPCGLLTTAEAASVLGGKVEAPVEAPQGPTCIYRTKSGETATIAIQSVTPAGLKRQVKRAERVDVSGRRAYCATGTQHVLYLPVTDDRVLSISAPCDIARRLAVNAVPRLPS